MRAGNASSERLLWLCAVVARHRQALAGSDADDEEGHPPATTANAPPRPGLESPAEALPAAADRMAGGGAAAPSSSEAAHPAGSVPSTSGRRPPAAGSAPDQPGGEGGAPDQAGAGAPSAGAGAGAPAQAPASGGGRPPLLLPRPVHAEVASPDAAAVQPAPALEDGGEASELPDYASSDGSEDEGGADEGGGGGAEGAGVPVQDTSGDSKISDEADDWHEDSELEDYEVRKPARQLCLGGAEPPAHLSMSSNGRALKTVWGPRQGSRVAALRLAGCCTALLSAHRRSQAALRA